MQKRLAILAVFIFGTFAFWGPCVAENQNGSAHTAHNQANTYKQPPQPASSTVYSPGCCTTETADTKKEPEEKPLPRFLRAEWVIVYVTVVYTGVAWFTLWKIADQANTMREHALELKSLADAARDNASAAERNAESLITAERPWVDVIIDADSDGVFDFLARNYGRTPAEIISGKGNCKIIDGEEDVPILPDRSDDLFDEKTLLLPYSESANQSVFERAVCSVSPKEFLETRSEGIQRMVRDGEKFLAIYGIVVYEDILVGEPHHTRFCYLLNSSTGELDRWGPEGANEHT
jgi:hypothetical protein